MFNDFCDRLFITKDFRAETLWCRTAHDPNQPKLFKNARIRNAVLDDLLLNFGKTRGAISITDNDPKKVARQAAAFLMEHHGFTDEIPTKIKDHIILGESGRVYLGWLPKIHEKHWLRVADLGHPLTGYLKLAEKPLCWRECKTDYSASPYETEAEELTTALLDEFPECVIKRSDSETQHTEPSPETSDESPLERHTVETLKHLRGTVLNLVDLREYLLTEKTVSGMVLSHTWQFDTLDSLRSNMTIQCEDYAGAVLSLESILSYFRREKCRFPQFLQEHKRYLKQLRADGCRPLRIEVAPHREVVESALRDLPIPCRSWWTIEIEFG